MGHVTAQQIVNNYANIFAIASRLYVYGSPILTHWHRKDSAE